jgi:hypothetical protein
MSIIPNHRLIPADSISIFIRIENAKGAIMKPDSNCIGLNLRKDAMLRLRDGAGVQIACRDGTAWITLDNDRRDFVLEAGDHLTINEHRRTLITALAASAITLCAAPAAAQSPNQRYRRRPGLVFEQVAV